MVEIFIIICSVLVFGFAISLFISTMVMGKPIFITLQVLMGSLRYSKEVSEKLDMELGKVEADLYHVVVGEHKIGLYSKEKYPDAKNIGYTSNAELEIWIENKFYSYGNIYRLSGGEAPLSMKSKRPSVKIIKQIYHLEKTNGQSTKKVKHDKSKAKKVVLE